MSRLAQNKSFGVQGFGVQRYTANQPTLSILDQLAVEEPLEILVCFRRKGLLVRKPISITMRTPGMDEELAIGFLYTEGIIHAAGADDKFRCRSSPARKALLHLVKLRCLRENIPAGIGDES